MYSMTGYGRAEYNENNIDLIVEIRTVNNRNFDFNSKMPRAFLQFEDEVRKTVANYVSRARIDLFIAFSDKRESLSPIEIDLERAKNLYAAANTISESIGVKNDLTPSALLRFPDVIIETIKSDASEFKDILIKAVKLACENLNAMRKIEGEKLIDDMLSRMETIKSLREKIAARAPMVAKDYAEKLKERIETALAGVSFDETRLLNEVAFFTDKSNIDEELTRLNSHINQFTETVNKAGSGKKLDFLMQEFNRETNTICSKSNDIEITGYALSLKNEIEKVREQVQNIE